MVRASYEYKWDGDILVIRYKRRAGIVAQLGNAKLLINPRITPKKYVFAVTGNARARKGIIPNSLAKLTGRWAFMPQEIKVEKKPFKDDFGQEHELIIPKFDKDNSFNNKGEDYRYDGALIIQEDAVAKIFS